MNHREERLSRYDDDQVLSDYLFSNYRHFLTELEVRVDRAVHAELKAEWSDSNTMTNQLRKRWGYQSHPDILHALENGVEGFRDRVRIRMLADHGAEIMINRCPKCSRIVATPRARQCLWCGHDWH